MTSLIPKFQRPGEDDDPEFASIEYPATCRERFMELTTQRNAARYHADKKALMPGIEQTLDAYNTWLAVYG